MAAITTVNIVHSNGKFRIENTILISILMDDYCSINLILSRYIMSEIIITLLLFCNLRYNIICLQVL